MLTAVLLGPAAAVVVMTCVLVVQCLVFNDGGLLALGANVFNMAIVNTCGGFLVFRLLKRVMRMENNRATVFAAAFAGWFGTVLASITCAGQLALSGRSPWSVAFPAMALVHMVIGVGEGLATALITMAVLRARPELVAGTGGEARAPGRGVLGYGLLISLGLVVFVAPFACPWPDGWRRWQSRWGLRAGRASPLIKGPVSEYRAALLARWQPRTAAAGVIGAILVFIGAYGLARFLAPGLDAAKKDAPSGN